ncbi:MAG: topoisomerase DNA-binding C4 zinc finger domain-containing protein [Elusimicrobiota bacterium]
MKECPKCKKIHTAEDFKDSSLMTGYGRFCKYCKGQGLSRRGAKTTRSDTITSKFFSDKAYPRCPHCGMRMVLRNGRRGRFYGCSMFPHCKGTRSF